MNSSACLLFLVTFLLPAPSPAASDAGPGAGSTEAPVSGPGREAHARLQEAVDRALALNPKLLERRLRIHAAGERAAQVSALPAPTLSVGVQNLPLSSLSFREDEMTMKMLGLEQDVPGRGKRPAAVRAARAQVVVDEASLATLASDLAAEVSDVFFDIASFDARIEIGRRSLERLGRITESVRNRYRVGQGSLSEVLLADVEESRGRERIRGLESDRAVTAARLNTLQGLPLSQPVPPVPWPAVDASDLRADGVEHAQDSSPAVRQARAEVARSQEELAVARLERRPDLVFMGSYGQRQLRDDMVSVTAGVSLPFARRKRIASGVGEREAELAAARRALESVQLDLSQRIEEARIRLAGLAERSALYRTTILAQDRTAAQAAEEAYSVGKIDFQTLVAAALAADMDETEAILREAELFRVRARLHFLTGRALAEPVHEEVAR